MMNIQIIQVPYDSGRRSVGTGTGPAHFVQSGLESLLQNSGHQVSVASIDSHLEFPTEIGTTFDVNRILSERVQAAVRGNALSELKNRVDGIYLHIDMDVLATDKGQPNHLAVPGGLTPHMLKKAIGTIKKHFTIKGCTVASYDPAFDEASHVVGMGIEIINSIVAC